MSIPRVDGSGFLRLKWKTIAIGSLLLNLAAIGGISAVSVVQNADALPTVALLLAIVAFICQLIVYAIQAAQASEQLRQAKDLNAGTESLLAEARARIEGTNRMVSSQYQEFLHLMALKSGTDVVSSLPEGESIDRQDVLRVVEKATEDISFAMTIGGSPQESLPAIPEGAIRSTRGPIAWTISIERARELYALLKGKKVPVGIFAIDVAAFSLGREVGQDGAIKRMGSDDRLSEIGLVTEGPIMDGERSVVLTQKGMEAAQLLAAPWPPPEHLAEMSNEIWALRQSLDVAVRSFLSEHTP